LPAQSSTCICSQENTASVEQETVSQGVLPIILIPVHSLLLLFLSNNFLFSLFWYALCWEKYWPLGLSFYFTTLSLVSRFSHILVLSFHSSFTFYYRTFSRESMRVRCYTSSFLDIDSHWFGQHFPRLVFVIIMS